MEYSWLQDFPGDSDGKVSVYNAGDLGLVPGWGRFPGEGNGNPLQHSCLENPMDRGAWCPWGRIFIADWHVVTVSGGRQRDSTIHIHESTPIHFQMCTQSSLTLCNIVNCSPSQPSVCGIFQTRILEWVAISSFWGSSWPRDRTWVSCIAGRFFLELSHWGSHLQMRAPLSGEIILKWGNRAES